MATLTAAPPTWDELAADDRFQRLTGGERLGVLDQWHADVRQHLGQDYDEAAAASYLETQRAKIAAEGQSPISTAARSFMTGAGEVFTATVEGLGGLATDVAQAADQLSGIPGVGQAALGAVPMAQSVQAAAPFAEVAQQEIVRTYAPDARLNPWAATLGGAAGQAVAMMPSAVAGPAGPLTLGGAMGYGQGREQATELGVTDPLGRMALGAGFAGAELLTERLGGLGAGPMTQAFSDVVQRVGGNTLKTIGSEAIEEPITGFAQDAMSFGTGQLVQDPNRPGFTTTGVELAPLSPLSPQAFDRRVQELAGGAVGGTVFAGAARLAGAGAPKMGDGRSQMGSGPPPLPLPEGDAGATDEDFSQAEQRMISKTGLARAARQRLSELEAALLGPASLDRNGTVQRGIGRRLTLAEQQEYDFLQAALNGAEGVQHDQLAKAYGFRLKPIIEPSATPGKTPPLIDAERNEPAPATGGSATAIAGSTPVADAERNEPAPATGGSATAIAGSTPFADAERNEPAPATGGSATAIAGSTPVADAMSSETPETFIASLRKEIERLQNERTPEIGYRTAHIRNLQRLIQYVEARFLQGNPTPPASSLQPQASVPSIDNIGAKFRGPEMARAVPVVPDNPLGYRDSLDFLNEMPIAIGRSGTGGELDWQETASIPKYYRPFIASEQGLPIDVVAQAAYEAQLIPQPTADALMERVQRDIGERRQYRVQGRQQQRDMLAQEKQARAFDKSQQKVKAKPGAQELPLDMLATGDQLTIDGEPVTVRAVDSDQDGYVTRVVLEDGKKFGVQEFNPQTREGVFVDEYQPRPQLAEGGAVFSRSAPQRGLGRGLGDLMGGQKPEAGGLRPEVAMQPRETLKAWGLLSESDFIAAAKANPAAAMQAAAEIGQTLDASLPLAKLRTLHASAQRFVRNTTLDAPSGLPVPNRERAAVAPGTPGPAGQFRPSPLIADREAHEEYKRIGSLSEPEFLAQAAALDPALLARVGKVVGMSWADQPSRAQLLRLHGFAQRLVQNANTAGVERDVSVVGRGDTTAQTSAPKPQPPASTPLSRTLMDQAEAASKDVPGWQRGDLDKLFTRARNLLANNGNVEVRPTDPVTVPEALAKIAAGEPAALVAGQWAEHRNNYTMGKTTEASPWTPGLTVPGKAAAVVKDSLTVGEPAERLLAAYRQLDRTGQGYIRIPDMARAAGLTPEETRAVLAELDETGQAYLTPADEPRNIPEADRPYLVNGPSGKALYVTLVPEGTALASPSITAAQDAAYMAAVEAGDMATVRRMVDQAAKAADITYVAKVPISRISYGTLPGVGEDRKLQDGDAEPIILERTAAGDTLALADGYHRLEGMLLNGETEVTVIILNSEDSDSVSGLNEQREFRRIQEEHKGESADPVTRDEQGNVIPLSRRFNKASDDIRYSPSTRAVLKRNTAVNKVELTKLGLPTSTPKAVWGQKPVKEAMNRIAKDPRLPATVRRMAKLLQDADLTGLFLRVEADGRKKYTGLYQPLRNGQGELVINLRHLGVGNTDPALNMAETLVHEVLHHATYRALRGPKNDVQKSAIGNLEQLRRRVKAVLGSQQMADFDYQTSNLDEFIAALFTQKRFQEVLAGIPAEQTPKSLVQQVRTLLDEAFRLLAEIVTGKKVPPGSVLDAAFQNALRLVEDGVRVAGTEKVGALASPAQPPRLPESVPSQAVPLKPEFGGAFPDHQAYKATDMQAWAAAEAQRLGADGVAAAVEAGQFGAVDVPFILAAAMMDTNAALKAAKTQADQTRQQVRLNRLRALLTPQNSVAGQTLAAQRDALGPMRERVPSLAVDEAVEKAQVQTIDAAVPVQPTVDGLDGLATQASAEATETLGGMLGEGQRAEGEGTESTPQEQAAADDELTRLRQQVTAQRNQFARYTEQLQRVMQKLLASGQRKAAILKGLRDEVQMSARNAIERAKAAMKGLRSPAQGAANAVEPNLAQVGYHMLVSEGVGFNAWSAAMVRTMGPMQPSTLEAVYGAAVDLYEQAVDRLDAQAKAKTPSKPRTQGTAKADPVATAFPDLSKLLRKLGPVVSGLNWRQIFTSTATAQRQWELDTYAQIRQHPKLSELTPEQARNLTRELSKAWQRERRKVWKRELDKTLVKAGMAKPKHRAKIEASAPRLLALINLGALNAATFRDAVAKEFGLRSIHDAEVVKIKEAAEKLQGLPPGTVPHRRAAQRFIEGLEDITGLSKTQILESWWTAAVLSGWRTQVDIALGVANAFEDVGFGSVITAVRTGNYGVAGRAMLEALGRAATALPEAMHHVLTGNKATLASYDAEIKAMFEDGHATMGQAGRALIKRGGWRTAPGAFMVGYARLMTALDHVTSSAGKAGALWMARANHPALYKAAQSITAKDRAAARAQALQVITGGAEPTTQAERLEVKRYTEELLTERTTPTELEQQASDVGLAAALQGEPTGIGKIVYDLLSAMPQRLERTAAHAEKEQWSKTGVWLLRNASQVSRILFGTKFLRAASQATNRAVAYVPGIGAVNYSFGTRWGTPAGDVLMAKQLTGLALGLGLLYLFRDREEDDDKGLEGGWAGLTPEQRGQLLAQGKQPYSLWYRNAQGKIVSYNYQQWGINNILAMVGHMRDARRYLGRDMDAELTLTGIGYGLWSIMDKAQLSGLSAIFGQNNIRSSSGEGLVRGLNKWASQTVGGLIPRIIKDIDQVVKPELTRTDHWWQTWAREVPILRTQSSGARVNVFGEPITLQRGPTSRLYQVGPQAREYQILAALNQRDVWITDPSVHPRKVKLATDSRDMKPEEKDRYARKAGQLTKDWLLENGERLLKMEPSQAQDLISQRTAIFRAMAVNAAVRR